jgi:hypothetical protein
VLAFLLTHPLLALPLFSLWSFFSFHLSKKWLKEWFARRKAGRLFGGIAAGYDLLV